MIKQLIDRMLADVEELKNKAEFPDITEEYIRGFSSAVTGMMLHHSDLLAEQGDIRAQDASESSEGTEVAPTPTEPRIEANGGQ